MLLDWHLMLFAHLIGTKWWATKGFKNSSCEKVYFLIGQKMKHVKNSLKPIKDSCAHHIDGWIMERRKKIINVIAVFLKGANFLSAVDC